MRFRGVLFLVALLLVVLLVVPVVALAQGDNPQPGNPVALPDTAQEAVEQVAVILAVFAGIVASYVTDWIKKLPYLTGPDKEQLGGAVSQLIVIVVSVGSGYLTAFLAQYATQVDNSGLWKLILTFGPLVFAEIRYQFLKLRQAQEAKAGLPLLDTVRA